MPKTRKHLLILAVLTLAITAALAYLFLKFSFLPTPASSQASTIDKLFSVMFAIAGFFLALCLVALIYSAIAFRRRRGDTSDGPPIQGNTVLETAWILIPLAIVIALGVVGGLALSKISAAPEEPELEVKVTALQWAWLFEYPEWEVKSGELRLPVDRPVIFRLTSRDVVHSLWVPEFRVKMDAVPGRETTLRVTPNRVGDYQLLCAEMCGLGHTFMRASVRVVPEADFIAWIQSQKPAEGAQGKALYIAKGCNACHGSNGEGMAGLAPKLVGIYGGKETLADGSQVTVDDAYLAESITNPAAKVVQGFQPIMPSFTLNAAEIKDIIAYIASLKQ